MDLPEQNETANIALKILGAVLAFFSFRWVIKLFAGDDGKLSVTEFLKFLAAVFFLVAGGFMIYEEAQRTDLSHQVYGWGYLIVVFTSLLMVLHLESVVDKILVIIQKLIELKQSFGTTNIQKTETTNTQITNP